MPGCALAAGAALRGGTATAWAVPADVAVPAQASAGVLQDGCAAGMVITIAAGSHTAAGPAVLRPPPMGAAARGAALCKIPADCAASCCRAPAGRPTPAESEYRDAPEVAPPLWQATGLDCMAGLPPQITTRGAPCRWHASIMA